MGAGAGGAVGNDIEDLAVKLTIPHYTNATSLRSVQLQPFASFAFVTFFAVLIAEQLKFNERI